MVLTGALVAQRAGPPTGTFWPALRQSSETPSARDSRQLRELPRSFRWGVQCGAGSLAMDGNNRNPGVKASLSSAGWSRFPQARCFVGGDKRQAVRDCTWPGSVLADRVQMEPPTQVLCSHQVCVWQKIGLPGPTRGAVLGSESQVATLSELSGGKDGPKVGGPGRGLSRGCSESGGAGERFARTEWHDPGLPCSWVDQWPHQRAFRWGPSEHHAFKDTPSWRPRSSDKHSTQTLQGPRLERRGWWVACQSWATGPRGQPQA